VDLLHEAALSNHPGPYLAVIVLGFVIGIYGHIIRSRPLIVAGILIVGAVSGYFAFVVGRLGQ
jgi:hypothetical protein